MKRAALIAMLTTSYPPSAGHLRSVACADRVEHPCHRRGCGGGSYPLYRSDGATTEAANVVAPAATGILFLDAVTWAVRRGASTVQLLEVAIGAFVLLTTALSPRYVRRGLPLYALGGSWAWAAVAALAPSGCPLDESQGRGGWHDPVWTGAVEHGASWTALAIDRWWTSGIILKLGETSPRRW